MFVCSNVYFISAEFCNLKILYLYPFAYFQAGIEIAKLFLNEGETVCFFLFPDAIFLFIISLAVLVFGISSFCCIIF